MDTTQLPEDGIIRLVGWPDPLADSIGHDVHSDYAERYWLGVVGPTAMWLLRRCSRTVNESGSGSEIDLAPLAQSLGLSFRAGRTNPFSRGFERLAMFGMIRLVATLPVPTYAVRTRVPPLSQRQLARLPLALQESHGRDASLQHA